MTISCPALNPKLCSSSSPSCVSLPVVASTHVRRLPEFLRTIRPSPPARQQTRHARAHRAANATRVMRRWLQPDPLKPLPGAGPWSPSAAGRCRNGGQLQRLRDAAGRVPFGGMPLCQCQCQRSNSVVGISGPSGNSPSWACFPLFLARFCSSPLTVVACVIYTESSLARDIPF